MQEIKPEDCFNDEDSCSMCYETKGVYPLTDLIEENENAPYIVHQAKLLLELGFKLQDKYCEECFWK